MELQNLWSSKAEKQGAAPISFRNDVDDEAIPPISPNFCYLEANYKLLSFQLSFLCLMTFSDVFLVLHSAIGVRKPPDDFLVTCSCHECIDATACGCQDASDIADDDGYRTFAYTRSVRSHFVFLLNLLSD